MKKKSKLMLLALIFVLAVIIHGADSESIDQRQLDWFGSSTLKNVKEVFPQVALEIIEKNTTKPNFAPQIGPLTQKQLQTYLEQMLQKSGIKTTNKFSATSANSPLSLNVTVFARVRDDVALPSYAVYINTEALQPEMLIRDTKIRSFSRTWPMVPTGDGARALLFLNPETIVDGIKNEVTRQVRSFIIDYSNANPKMNIKIPEAAIQNPANDSPESKTSPVSPTDSELDSSVMKTGKITRVQVEGGFWGIIGDDGTKYDPINLPDEYKKDGLKVQFIANEKKNAASFHMWGHIVEIVKIEKA